MSEEFDPSNAELILVFTIVPSGFADKDDNDDEEIKEARSFSVRTSLPAVDEVPWRRIAEVMSPFVIKVLGDGLLDLKPGDIQVGHSMVNNADIIGLARFERTRASVGNDADLDEEVAFSGMTILRYGFVGESSKSSTRIYTSFCQTGHDRIEFEESL